MNNGDILKFINSIDIRDYLRELNYRFNAAEAAWLINQCTELKLFEKHDALFDLMKSMPDPGIEAVPSEIFRRNYAGKDLYSLIGEYINAEKEIADAFYKEGDYAVYLTDEYCDIDDDFREQNTRDMPNPEPYIYWDENVRLADAYSSFKKLLASETEDYEELACINVYKKYIDKSRQIDVWADRGGELLSVWHLGSGDELTSDTDILTLFDEMWFNFPVPFKRGDIVCYSRRNAGLSIRHHDSLPFVVRSTTYGDTLTTRKGYVGCDASDMTVSAYFLSENGEVYTEVEGWLMDLEYYRRECRGILRSLPLLSEVMKTEEHDPYYELLMNGYLKYRLDNYANQAAPLVYADETEKKLRLKESE